MILFCNFSCGKGVAAFLLQHSVRRYRSGSRSESFLSEEWDILSKILGAKEVVQTADGRKNAIPRMLSQTSGDLRATRPSYALILLWLL